MTDLLPASEATPAIVDEDPRWAKAREFAKEGGAVALKSAGLIVSRALAWGTLGVVIAACVWGGLLAAGLLALHAHPPMPAVFAGVMLVLGMIAGGGILGYVGAMRGIGRSVLHVGVERGLVLYLAAQILDRAAARLGQIDRAEQAAQILRDLPLQRWEDALKGATADVLGEDLPGEATGLRKRALRRLRGFIGTRIERYLLTIVRAESTDEGQGGGVSMTRVRDVALEQTEAHFGDLVEGMMFKQLALGVVLVVLAQGVGPLIVFLAAR